MSSGRDARVSFRALCISSAFPSKNRPQPGIISSDHDLDRVELTSNKQSITGENNTLITILHEVADTVLRVARCVQGLNGDTLPNLELLTVCRSLGDRLALPTPNDRELAELLQLEAVNITQPTHRAVCAYHLIVSAGMVPVASP